MTAYADPIQNEAFPGIVLNFSCVVNTVVVLTRITNTMML